MRDLKKHNIYQIAFLVALACVLQISESLIPHPIPGLRLGLSNMITLTALVVLGFKYALEIAILRTILSSFILGTFMSPGFFLSFAGAIISTLVMGFFFWLSGFHVRYGLSIIGIGIIGAFSHNMVQLFLAYLLLIKHSGIFIFFPWLSIGAVVTGWVIGITAGGVCRNLENIQRHEEHEDLQPYPPASIEDQYRPGQSFMHRVPAHIKIMSVFALSLAVFITNNFWFYTALFVFLATAVILSHTPLSFLFLKIRRYISLIALAFLLPLFFNSGTHVVITLAHFNITHEGLTMGALFASRITFLILVSALLVRTTSPQEMARGLTTLLSPLKYMGVPVQRISIILSLSWAAIPAIQETTRRAVKSADLKRIKNFHKLIPFLSRLIATLYMDADSRKMPEKKSDLNHRRRHGIE